MTSLRSALSNRARRDTGEHIGRFLPIFLCLLSWVILVCLAESARAIENNAEYRSDQILVMPRSPAARSRLTRFHLEQGTKVLRSLTAANGLQIVAVPAGENVPSLVAKYRGTGLVQFAEPDYLRQLDLTTPNDPMFMDGT